MCTLFSSLLALCWCCYSCCNVTFLSMYASVCVRTSIKLREIFNVNRTRYKEQQRKNGFLRCEWTAPNINWNIIYDYVVRIFNLENGILHETENITKSHLIQQSLFSTIESNSNRNNYSVYYLLVFGTMRRRIWWENSNDGNEWSCARLK